MTTLNTNNYPDNILEALQSIGVKSIYDKKKQLIYVCQQGVYGDIFTIYSKFGTMIESHTIYDLVIGKASRKAVDEHLRVLNNKDTGLHFYIDKKTNCVAFNSQLSVLAMDNVDQKRVGDFCQEIHQNSIAKQEELFVLLTSKERVKTLCL